MIKDNLEYQIIYNEILKETKKTMTQNEIIEYLVIKCFDLKMDCYNLETLVNLLEEKLKKINIIVSDFQQSEDEELNDNSLILPF